MARVYLTKLMTYCENAGNPVVIQGLKQHGVPLQVYVEVFSMSSPVTLQMSRRKPDSSLIRRGVVSVRLVCCLTDAFLEIADV